MSSHMPGPWRTTRNNFIRLSSSSFGSESYRIVYGPRPLRRDIAYVVPQSDDDNGNANARLIAEAPHLLAVLTAILYETVNDEHMRSETREHAARLVARLGGPGEVTP